MEARPKVTKEVLCEESRFILANILAESRYGRQNRFEDIRRVCEGAVSIPFSEYIGFLDNAGYLRHDRGSESLTVTSEGELIVNGADLTELTERAVTHFKNIRTRRRQRGEDSVAAKMLPSMTSSGGRGSASVGGEIGAGSEVVDSRYEKLAKLGSGGVGSVYRARQVALNREVALKEVRELYGFFSEAQHAEITRRFTDVVRAAASLAHPNILPIHDVNVSAEFPYVVSELAPNGSARRLISDAETIPVALAVKYLLQTMHALRAAHSARVIHRGLKPENLLIDAFGNVKVSDFGFARIVERETHSRQVYVGLGNIAYMAPELYSDPGGAGPQADIYALGIIFYELLTRKLPGRRSPLPTETNSALPKGIDDIFDLMTRDSRTERYTNVDDILDDINKLDGLGEVLDQQTQVLVANNPLADIKFKENPASEESSVETSADPASSGAAAAVADEANGDDSSKSARRPYSYQQRRKR